MFRFFRNIINWLPHLLSSETNIPDTEIYSNQNVTFTETLNLIIPPIAIAPMQLAAIQIPPIHQLLNNEDEAIEPARANHLIDFLAPHHVRAAADEMDEVLEDQPPLVPAPNPMAQVLQLNVPRQNPLQNVINAEVQRLLLVENNTAVFRQALLANDHASNMPYHPGIPGANNGFIFRFYNPVDMDTTETPAAAGLSQTTNHN